MDKLPQGWKKWIKNGQTHFCSGCQYGTVLNYLACALAESGIERRKVAAVSGIGCAAWITDRYLNTDTMHTTHGRPIAFATGIKKANPGLSVIVVSGDGDLVTIGGNHLIHAARRDMDITVICVNNFIYGMTGGQAGATTPSGAVTSTTPAGNQDKPLDIIQLVLSVGCRFAARYPVMHKKPLIVLQAITKAFKHPGFSFVELVAPCATHFNRKNGIPSAKEMIAYLGKHYVTAKKNGAVPASENQMLCGVFRGLDEYCQPKKEDESCAKKS